MADDLGVVCVFRSLRTANIPEVYAEWSDRMTSLVAEMPGYIAHTSWRDQNSGEGVTIAYFDSEASLKNWGGHPVHQRAQHLGRVEFYQEYTVEIATITSRHSWRLADS